MSNYTFCTCKDWQEFINNSLEIRLGQPVIKADKHAMLLPLQQRCNLVTEAQPKVKGFVKSKNRLYLPLGLEQIALFLRSKDLQLEAKWLKHKVVLKCNNFKTENKDWYLASGALLDILISEGIIE